MRTRLVAAGAVFALALFLTTCGGDGDGDTAEEEGGASTVAVTLQEFAVAADPASVPAGSVTFDVTNEGPEDVHEFVVIKTDLAPTELPTDEDGVVEESGEGMEVVDEIEDIPIGETQSLTAELDAGAYALICNIFEKGEAHYSLGMRTGFTVG